MIDALWAQAFAVTVAVEVPVIVLAAPRGRRGAAAGIAFATQTFTHPLAWMAFTHGVLGWWGVEVAVVLVESCVYAIASRRPFASLAVATFANVLSAVLGLWLLEA